MTDSPLIKTARAIFAARMSKKDLNLTLQHGGVDFFAAKCFDLAALFEAEADKHRPRADAPAQLAPETNAATHADQVVTGHDLTHVLHDVEMFTVRLRAGATAAFDSLESHMMPEQHHPHTIYLTPYVNLDLAFRGQPKGQMFTGWMVEIPIPECGPFKSAAVILLYSADWHSTKRFRGDGVYTHWTDAGQDEISQYIKSLPLQVRHGLEMVLSQVIPPIEYPLAGGNVLAIWPHRHAGRWCFSIIDGRPVK